MFQVAVFTAINQSDANEQLRVFQKEYPKRQIVNINMEPIDWPGGWFVIINYKIER